MQSFNKAFLFLLLIFCKVAYSQGGASSCTELEAHYEQYQSCATSVPFDNSTGNTSGETFQTSCIGEPFRGPTWFFMDIKESGNIRLRIKQVSNSGGQSDVDFVLWGPFDNLNDICDQLNPPNEVDCSWSSDSIEIANITNAVAGQLYVLLVDNYSDTPGQITISQISGSGSSDCSFLSSVKIQDTAGNEITQLGYCKPATKTLSANVDTTDFPGNVTNLRFNYKWYKDDVLITTVTASVYNTNSLIVSETGIYRVEATAYDSTDPTVIQDELRISKDEITLQFLETPVISSAVIALEQCDYITPNNDGIATVDLTQTYDSFVNGNTAISLKYYYDAALTLPIADPAQFTNTVPFNQDIYVIGTYSGQPFVCTSNVGKIALKINPTSIANYSDPAPVCPELNTSASKIDLDAHRAVIKNSFFPTSNVTIAFYISPLDASIEQNELTNDYEFPVGFSTVYTRVETDNSCTGIGTFEVQVYNAPVQNTITVISTCQSEAVYLAAKDTEVLSGQNPTVQSSYFYSFDNAKNNTSSIAKNTPLTLTVGTTLIFVRLFDSSISCFSIVSFDLDVFANPAFTAPDPISVCGGATATFNLNIRIPQIISNHPDYQVTFYESQADLDADTPIPTPESYESANKTILVKIIDPTNNNCSATSSLQLKVSENPGSTNNPELLEECEDSGFYSFDLTSREPEMAGSTAINDIEFRYYINLPDAQINNNNFILTPNAFTNTVIDYQKIYVRLNSKTSTDSEAGIACYRILELELFVRPYPKNHLTGVPYRICVDINDNVISPAIIDTELPLEGYSFTWYNGFNTPPGAAIAGATSNTLSTSVEGVYSVEIIDTTHNTLCTTVINFTTVNSVAPYSIVADPAEQISFESDNTVTAIVTPQSSEFEYMIDNLGWQQSNVFKNVKEGVHKLTVRHAFGCGEVSTRVVVVDYPRFFTPNGDGYNDTWNVGGRVSLDISTIYIFDRSGKLLKELPGSDGWDGTFNGNPLPADDYWFKIEFQNSGVKGEFSSHFALKR